MILNRKRREDANYFKISNNSYQKEGEAKAKKV
jgi:hypothetical protein